MYANINASNSHMDAVVFHMYNVLPVCLYAKYVNKLNTYDFMRILKNPRLYITFFSEIKMFIDH